MHPQPLTPYHHRPGRSPVSCSWHDSLELAAFPGAPGCARRHAVNVLRGWGLADLADDTGVVISELVSNAVQATRACAGPAPCSPATVRPTVRLCLHGRRDDRDAGVLVLVWDMAGGCPVPRPATAEEENGRGLAIIAALSADWGHYHPLPEGPEPARPGKVTWANVTMLE